MTTQTNTIKSPPYLPIVLISLLLVILTSCLLSPIYMQTENDVTFMYTVLPIILNFVIILFDSLYISLLTAVVSYSVYAVYKGASAKSTVILTSGAVVFMKHALNLAISSIIDSYIDVAFDIPVTLLLFIVDILLLLVVAIIANHNCKKHFSYAAKMNKAAKYLNTIEYDEVSEVFPFGGILNYKNPIVLPMMVGAIITIIILLAQRLFADLVVLGAPTSVFEIFEIIVSYLFDILLGVIGYIAAYFAAYYIFLRSPFVISDNNED